ncbi:hypothetical protein NAT65_01245 [Achromobacter xylosoxidans]|uniref:gp53-like domain-containing protein n=1 Tax=Alcaligenes xylosoxydans xylosoxydans TaxID=85698 RepID=UPI002040868F|nr:hypothetical protein [Achromobacter xylosoxidans]MCM2569695.1 hypothetical protein [Achromobacter xylosoxidans]
MDLLIAPYTVAKEQADTAPATGTPGWATDGNPAANVPATQWPAYAFNALQEELATVIVGGGLSLNRNDNTLLLKAIQGLIEAASRRYAIDVGTANSYRANYTPAVSALVDGTVLRFRAVSANTGACSFAVNNLPSKPLIGLAGSSLQGGEIAVGSVCEVAYTQPLDSWVMVSSSGGRLQIPDATRSKHAVTLSQVQSLIPAVPNASTTVAGISRFSTASEAQSWSEAATVLTPSSLAQSFGAANQSLAPNGYQRLPGGLIIQWALGPGANPAQDSTVSYPIPFPTRTLQAVASLTSDCDCVAQVMSFNQNSATVRLDAIGSNTSGSAPRVFAIGH